VGAEPVLHLRLIFLVSLDARQQFQDAPLVHRDGVVFQHRVVGLDGDYPARMDEYVDTDHRAIRPRGERFVQELPFSCLGP
jgi:hypothetical protein